MDYPSATLGFRPLGFYSEEVEVWVNPATYQVRWIDRVRGRYRETGIPEGHEFLDAGP